MGMRKFRERVVVQSSLTMRGTEATPTLRGWLNASGVLVPTSDGAAVGSNIVVNLQGNGLRIPSSGSALGTATTAQGTSEGKLMAGKIAGSAQLAVSIGGTIFVLSWPTAGGAIDVRPNPAGAA